MISVVQRVSRAEVRVDGKCVGRIAGVINRRDNQNRGVRAARFCLLDFVDDLEVAQRLLGLRIPSRTRGVVALYDVTDDWMPIYDRSDLDGFYMAVGTSGNQFKNAPVAGKMMAALVEACEAGQDHDRDPVTFHLEHLEMDISLGAFSRNREINQDSSFSVIG